MISPELNIPVLFPIVFTDWTNESSFIHVIPVPGRTVSVWGTKVLLRIWMVVTSLVCGDRVLFNVGETIVIIIVGSGVGAAVNSVVGMVVAIVVSMTVTGSACCVHPVNAIKAITKIIKPKYFFMKVNGKSL
jgi:hypothetical protein